MMSRSSSSELTGLADLGTAKRICIEENLVDMEATGFITNSSLKTCSGCFKRGVMEKTMEREEAKANYIEFYLKSMETDEFANHDRDINYLSMKEELGLTRQRLDHYKESDMKKSQYSDMHVTKVS
ncbi:hypothetical protein HNY73_008117 [Argiope bruennichi]|uniref:Uncharacterized protein n=1 Tax=Argiope bruennichi TaxID=94029 RepID=A0A8T0F5B6_ARGBR|nr:hypothetical protein HNY73_008117 [Argiope bruennichi]